MCRHLAWVGAPRSLHELVVAPPYSLYRQSWAPRRQQYGTVNADGFGVGWYVDERPEPVRYRRAEPIWSDASFASLAPTVRSGCVLAAVRSATPGTSAGAAGAAPFTHGRWLFSHNGRLHDWAAARRALPAEPTDEDVPDARADVDSALLFGVAVAAWRAGAGLLDGLVEAADAADRHGGGRVTLLATDGVRAAGLVRAGEGMVIRTGADGVLVASEPDDDGTGWEPVPDGTGLTVTADDLTLVPA